jgi:hypothetical protein
MKNKGLATKLSGDPLDNIRWDAKLVPIGFPAAFVGEAAKGGRGTISFSWTKSPENRAV